MERPENGIVSDVTLIPGIEGDIVSLEEAYKKDPYLIAPSSCGDITLTASREGGKLVFKTGSKFLRRLWFLISLPFVYLFRGRVRL